MHGTVLQCDATSQRFRDAAFDIVYSFGVLHHIPQVDRAMKEIRRVLKPGGEVLAMLYNRSSINYQLEIKVLRKLGVRLLEAPGLITLLGAMGLPREKLERHRGLRRCGRKMTEQEWLSRNTDGPDNPYSAVYGRDEANRLFRDFHVIANEVFYFNHEHWGPLGRALPAKAREALGRRWGWHRIIHARKP